MSIDIAVPLVVVLLALGALLATRAGIRSIQSARRVSFFRIRRAYMLAGWKWLLLGLFLFSSSVASALVGEPVANQIFSPAPLATSASMPPPAAGPVTSATPTDTPTQVQASEFTAAPTSTSAPGQTPSLTATASPSASPTLTPASLSSATPVSSPTSTGTPAPTATPLPTRTATADRSCDRIEVIADVNVPRNSVFAPGDTFTKIWRLKNVGTCTWTRSYRVVLIDGDLLGGQDAMPLPAEVGPGEMIDLKMGFTAPSAVGAYRGDWQLRNSQGEIFNMSATANRPFSVSILVRTPPPSGTVYDFVASACSAQWSSGAGTLICPGMNRDPLGYVSRQSLSRLENGTMIVRPSLLTIPQNVMNGSIQGVYPPFEVQKGDRFRAIVNCEMGATSCEVLFRLDYRLEDGVVHELWSTAERFDGDSLTVDVDLSPLAGQEVDFVLTVLSLGPASGDRAVWVEPRIVRSGSTPTPTP